MPETVSARSGTVSGTPWARCGLEARPFPPQPDVVKRLKKAEVDKRVRGWEHASDHALAWIELSDKQIKRRKRKEHYLTGRTARWLGRHAVSGDHFRSQARRCFKVAIEENERLRIANEHDPDPADHASDDTVEEPANDWSAAIT